MGKKSEDSKKPESQSILQSLFSGDNPFRRQPQPPAKSDGDAGESKKKKRELETRNPNSDPSSTPDSSEKRKKVENGDGEGRKERRKKRKREEIEAEYERRRLAAAATVAGGEEEGGRVAVVGEKRKAADLVAEESAAAPAESFDDESKLVRTVFVGNLPLKTKKKALLKEFGGLGEIESVRIRSVPIVDSKTPRKGAVIQGKFNEAIDSVHAYIVFQDEKSAKAALSHNMAQFGGNHIRVDMACPPRKKLRGEGPLYDRKRTVFVGNLPFDVKDEEIYQLFSGVTETESSVEAVRVIRDPNTSAGKGIAYVLFKSRDAANIIVKKKNLKIRDRILRVCHSKKLSDTTSTPLKRKANGAKTEFPRKKFAESGGEAHGNSDQPKARAPILSYQGLRSSKSGAVKKSATVTLPHPSKKGNLKAKRGAKDQKKSQSTKRPSVAARKAKQLVKKRKQENATPENTHRDKKLRSS